MAKGSESKKEIFKQIFRDGWEAFKARHPRYEAVNEVVQKMLGCGAFENGYAVYICPACCAEKKVPFRCKRSFCLSCAKTYTANWVETMQGMLHEGIGYRHLVLTVPEALRGLFYWYPAELYEGLMKIGAQMMDDAVSTAKGKALALGYIVVLQTAAPKGYPAANYNPHLHIIMTDGGLDEAGGWHGLGYLRYQIIHRKWQYYLLGMVKAVLSEVAGVAELVDTLWRQYPKGFVAHLQEETVPKIAKLAQYIAKYVVSPPMALSRLVSYDRETRQVTDWYRDHRTGQKEAVTLDRAQFIGRMVQTILPKGFQRVRYYGLQATCKLIKDRLCFQTALQKLVQGGFGWVENIVGKLRYPERMKRAYGLEPLTCVQCGAEMWLWYVWHPDYGVIDDELAQLRSGKYDLPPDIRLSEDKDESEPLVQLPLFRWPTSFVYT
jgi:hypothetical protein